MKLDIKTRYVEDESEDAFELEGIRTLPTLKNQSPFVMSASQKARPFPFATNAKNGLIIPIVIT